MAIAQREVEIGAVDDRCEIEVKYAVEDMPALERALAERGVALSAPICQDDQAYAPVWWDYGQSKLGVPFARLRTEAGRHVFTVKTPIGNAQDCQERETEVADREQMHGALLAMGFRPTVQIVKTRRKGQIGALAVCLDVVEQAGAFFEVELVTAGTGSGEQAQRDLDRFVASLGVRLRRTMETYDSLIRARQQQNPRPAAVAASE